ncbi:MAG: hypothetical protein KIT43_05095 [Bauldia sp.]|nr:hypothetical protein [Bauldia sp.]
MPVTTMEDIPVLNDAERADLLRALKEAEADISAGRFTEYDPATFKARFNAARRGAKR